MLGTKKCLSSAACRHSDLTIRRLLPLRLLLDLQRALQEHSWQALILLGGAGRGDASERRRPCIALASAPQPEGWYAWALAPPASLSAPQAACQPCS